MMGLAAFVLARMWGGLPGGFRLLLARLGGRLSGRPAAGYTPLAPAASTAMLTTSGAARPRPAEKQPFWLAVETCLGFVVFSLLAHFWFFRAIKMINALVVTYPQLEVVTYVALSIPPLLAVKSGVVGRLCDAATKSIAACMPLMALRHVAISYCQPLGVAMQSILLYLGLNLLVNATPQGFVLAMPEALAFLKTGLITADRIQDTFMVFSTGLLNATLVTVFGWFLWKAKAPPGELRIAEDEDSAWEPKTHLQRQSSS